MRWNHTTQVREPSNEVRFGVRRLITVLYQWASLRRFPLLDPNSILGVYRHDVHAGGEVRSHYITLRLTEQCTNTQYWAIDAFSKLPDAVTFYARWDERLWNWGEGDLWDSCTPIWQLYNAGVPREYSPVARTRPAWNSDTTIVYFTGRVERPEYTDLWHWLLTRREAEEMKQEERTPEYLRP